MSGPAPSSEVVQWQHPELTDHQRQVAKNLAEKYARGGVVGYLQSLGFTVRVQDGNYQIRKGDEPFYVLDPNLFDKNAWRAAFRVGIVRGLGNLDVELRRDLVEDLTADYLRIGSTFLGFLPQVGLMKAVAGGSGRGSAEGLLQLLAWKEGILDEPKPLPLISETAKGAVAPAIKDVVNAGSAVVATRFQSLSPISYAGGALNFFGFGTAMSGVGQAIDLATFQREDSFSFTEALLSGAISSALFVAGESGRQGVALLVRTGTAYKRMGENAGGMRIVWISDWKLQNTNGTAASINEGMAMLRERNIPVLAISPDSGKFSFPVKLAGIAAKLSPPHPFNPIKIMDLPRPFEILYALGQFQPSKAVISSEGPMALYTSLLLRLRGIPYVVSFHTDMHVTLAERAGGDLSRSQMAVLDSFVRAIYSGSSGALVPVPEFGARVRELGVKTTAPVVQWPRTVAPEFLTHPILPHHARENVVVWIGRFDPEKRPWLILAIAEDLEKRGYQLVLFGDGA